MKPTTPTPALGGQDNRLALALRSLLFFLGLTATTVVFAPLTLLTFPFPIAARFGFIRRWTAFNLWWLNKTCRIRCEIHGREHLPESPSIVLCKHESAWETLALQVVFSPLIWLLKRELLWIPFFGWGLAMLKPIAIDRSAGRRALEQLVEQGRQRLEEGCWIVIFPEGTRVEPGTKRRYFLGGAFLAERTGYPVVPVAHNAGDFWPRRTFIKRPGTIQLVIGPAIESRGRRAAEINKLAEEWIESTVSRIRGAAANAPRMHPPKKPNVRMLHTETRP